MLTSNYHWKSEIRDRLGISCVGYKKDWVCNVWWKYSEKITSFQSLNQFLNMITPKNYLSSLFKGYIAVYSEFRYEFLQILAVVILNCLKTLTNSDVSWRFFGRRFAVFRFIPVKSRSRHFSQYCWRFAMQSQPLFIRSWQTNKGKKKMMERVDLTFVVVCSLTSFWPYVISHRNM